MKKIISFSFFILLVYFSQGQSKKDNNAKPVQVEHQPVLPALNSIPAMPSLKQPLQDAGNSNKKGTPEKINYDIIPKAQELNTAVLLPMAVDQQKINNPAPATEPVKEKTKAIDPLKQGPEQPLMKPVVPKKLAPVTKTG